MHRDPDVQGGEAPPSLDRATWDALHVQARRLVRRMQDAEDLVQDTLLAAVRAGRGDLPWLMGTLRRQAALQARTAVRARRREAAALEGAPDPAADGEDLDPRPDWLRRLPPSGRKVAVLALHGLSADEIRWLLGITPAAFRQRLAAIRKSLARLPPAERGESVALSRIRDPARSADLQFGLARRALHAAMRGDGMRLGTHDGDGHLLVIGRHAHVPAPGGNG